MMPPPNNTKGTMSRITIDVLERQAEAMGLKVLESDIPGTTCGLYCDRLRTIWLADWLNDRQRLCTLCHELVHAKYRDLGCGTWHMAAELDVTMQVLADYRQILKDGLFEKRP